MIFKRALVMTLCLSLTLLGVCGCGKKKGDTKKEGGKVQTATEDEALTVLAIGHSFGNNSIEYAHQIAESLGKKLEISSLYYGGCTLEQHLDFYKKDEAVFTVYTNGVCVDNTPRTSKAILSEKQYDIITFQGHSISTDEIETFAPLEEFASIVRSHQPDAEFMIHQTWSLCSARLAGYKVEYQTYDKGRLFFDRTKANFAEAAKRLGNVKTVPVGEAIQYAKENYDYSDDLKNKKTMYADEISHLSPLGKYLAGCVWVQFLFPDVDVRLNAYENLDIDKTDRATLSQIAYKIVTEQ